MHNINDESIKKLMDEYLKAKENEASMGKVNENIMTLLKYLIDENRKTTLILKQMADRIDKLESRLSSIMDTAEQEIEDESDEEPSVSSYKQDISRNEVSDNRKIVTLTEQDKKILEQVQMRGMICADQLQKIMNYKGKNAASARLNRLCMLGLLIKLQIGHKTYFSYDPGKATNLVIVSPPD
ncbi:MAG: hypothetical protein ARM1_0459 [Candidatus Micrarchaeota archaeon]|nr:MAG: hypothetical protein ARM1_0459 [Candidatus Micrarchaeota archaeon]